MKLGKPGGRILFSTAMLSAASATRLAFQFVLVPILGRLLGPGAFGEMGIAMSFVLLANMLSDGGMGYALVRESDPSEDLESTVLSISMLIGLGLAAIICALSWPISKIYAQPGLMPLLCVLSLILPISGCLSVANSRIVRSQRFEFFAYGDFACTVLSAAAGITLAYLHYGVWSLAAQQLVLWITKALWVSYVAGLVPRPLLKWNLARSLFHFSVGNLASAVADFAGKSAPVLIVGGLLGAAAAGHYAMAYQFTRVADMIILSPVSMATFSTVAVLASQEAARAFVVSAWRVLLLGLAPLFCGLALTADPLIPLFLGPKWIVTAPVLAALCPGAFLMCIYGFSGAALLGIGRSGKVFQLTVLTGITLSIGTLAGIPFGVIWAAAGFSLGTLAASPFYLRALSMVMGTATHELVTASFKTFLATAAMACVVLLLKARLSGVPPLLELLVVVPVGAAVYVASSLVLGGKQIFEDVRALRQHRPAENSLEAKPEGSVHGEWNYLPEAPAE